MKIFKNFKLGEPKTVEHIKLRNQHNAQFLYDENGTEWYGCQKDFAQDTIKIAYDGNGIIRSIAYLDNDVSTLWPTGMSVAEVANTTANRRADISGDWVFDGDKITRRVYTAEELQAQAESHKERLIAYANKKTQAWQTQLMLGMISDEDKKSLIAWMAYVQNVQAVDTGLGLGAEWPDQPA